MLLTIQKKEVVDKIYEGEYKADIWKSDFAFLSSEYTKGYNIIKKRLEKKLNTSLVGGESYYWGWLYNPYVEFFSNKTNRDEYIALFVDISENDVVVSDYDKYTDFVHGESSSSDFFVDSYEDISPNSCLQCSFLDLRPEIISLKVPLSLLDGLSGDIYSIYSSVCLRSLWLVNCLNNKNSTLKNTI